MEIDSFPGQPRPRRNRLARISVYGTGIGCALLFGFILSDGVLDLASSDGSQVGIICVVGPSFILSVLCLLLGIVTGHIAVFQIRRSGEEGLDRAKNGIIFGYLGLAYVVLAPLVNLVLAQAGLQIPSVTDLFGW